MSAADVTTGFFGKIPATGDFVASGLPRIFIDRWDRWMSMELRDRPDEGELDPHAWRFVIKADIFGERPCAGVWRMSQDRFGRRYPFAVVRLGPPPEPGDAWFDAVAVIVGGALEDYRGQTWIIERIAQVPPPERSAAADRIVFWRDDWQVQELQFSDIHDLAAHALPTMRTAPALTQET